jgi:hypothetical protein
VLAALTLVTLACADGGDATTEGARAPAGTSAPASSATSAAPPASTATTTATTLPAPTGTFSAAAGSSATAGSGPLQTYAVEVEDGIGIDAAAFAADVDRILAAPKGWTAGGDVAFRRGPGGAVDFRVVLATPATTDRLCAPLQTNGTYSCHSRGRAVINLTRWTDGSAESRLTLDLYRIYVVSHEVGHAIGHDHVGCPGPGVPAPVMMQQTKGIGACSPNPWPFP